MKADVRRLELQQRNYGDAVSGVARLYRRPRLRVRAWDFLISVVCLISLAHFVTGSLATPIRDELFSFLVFLFTGLMFIGRIRRRAGRRARAQWVSERSGCGA